MTRLGGYRVIVHPGHVTPRKILVQLACLAALRPAGAAERCTVRLSPGDDLKQAVDGSAASGRATIVCLGAGEIRIRRFLAIARDVIVLRGEGAATILRLEDGTELNGPPEAALPRLPPRTPSAARPTLGGRIVP